MINRPPARPYRAFFCPARFADRPSIIRIEFCICFRAITSGTRLFTNCRASMEWLAMTRCPCRLVSTCCGSTYAEKYARYVEFRLSLVDCSFCEAVFFFVCVHTVARSALCVSFVISRPCPVLLPFPAIISLMHRSFFFFLVYFDAEKLISPIAAVTSLASFCLKQYTSYDRRGYLLQ